MAKNTTGDVRNNRFPLEAYNELRRWLGEWVNQEFDLDKRLAAFIALESLNSLGETMLGERMPLDCNLATVSSEPEDRNESLQPGCAGFI